MSPLHDSRRYHSNYRSRILSAGFCRRMVNRVSFQFLIPLGGAEHPRIRFFFFDPWSFGLVFFIFFYLFFVYALEWRNENDLVWSHRWVFGVDGEVLFVCCRSRDRFRAGPVGGCRRVVTRGGWTVQGWIVMAYTYRFQVYTYRGLYVHVWRMKSWRYSEVLLLNGFDCHN